MTKKFISFGIACLLLGMLAPSAGAADVPPAPAPAPVVTGYNAGQCGWYFGLNTMGGAGSVQGGAPGTTIMQGAVGGTLGYGCPIGSTPGNFWYAEGNFDWANINGSQNGFSLTGPAHFEQRVGLGSPLSTMLNVLGINNNNISVPPLPLLPPGVTAGTSYPVIFLSFHEQDVSAQVGGDSNRDWLFSPGIGLALENRLSNNVVVETAGQFVMQSSGFSVGPQTVKLGNAFEASVTLKYGF